MLSLCGCGYHVGGHSDLLPVKVKKIAVPAFSNQTNRYKLSGHLAEAIAREFIQRTRYQIVADPNDADAILSGSVINLLTFGVTSDQQTGRASGIQVNVALSVTLTDRETGAVLFARPSFEMRQRYEISQDPIAYFEEGSIGLERLSRDVARTIVSAILEAF
jgi:hypothetical protein